MNSIFCLGLWASGAKKLADLSEGVKTIETVVCKRSFTTADEEGRENERKEVIREVRVSASPLLPISSRSGLVPPLERKGDALSLNYREGADDRTFKAVRGSSD